MESQRIQELEDLIRRLKVLSKCQSAFLKKFLHSKVSSAIKVVNEGMDIIYRSNATDPRLAGIKKDVAALKIEDLNVDTDNYEILLKEEIALLTRSVNGETLSLPAVAATAATSTASATSSESAGDSQKTRTLEADNANLRELLKVAQAELTKSQQQLAKAQAAPAPAGAPMPPPPPDTTALDNLQAKYQALMGKIAEKDKELAAAKATISERDADIARITARAQEADLARTLQTEVATVKSEVANLQRELAKTKKEAEEKLAAKTRELTQDGNMRVAEAEKKLEEAREEMMDAMAQEVEAIEKQNLMEKEALAAEKQKVEQALAKVRNSRQAVLGGVSALARQAGSVSVEYKSLVMDTRSQLNDMKTALKSSISDALLFKLREVTTALTTMTGRYRKEMAERKKLHNLVQELKGNIRVFLRCRPPSSKELEQYGSESSCITFPNPGEVKVFNEKSREKTWEFDEVFDYDSTQEQIYTEVSALVTSVLDGYNVCIFAYGQTGSGKTFTMSGPTENRGVNTRALGELFTKTAARSTDFRDTITVSVLEVYNEDIHDLLAEGANGEKLEVRQGEFGNHVPGLTTVPVNNLQNVFDLLLVADRCRSQTATNMNEHSSRSHMMLTVTVVSENLVNGVVTRGRLNLVDLAGSERINKSGATGQALKEAQNINKSLSALGDVIAARAAKQGHIPFRNSTLTYLLQDSLSQDSKTLMIVCVSPVLFSAEETFCSLNFAARVRTVELGRASKQTLGAAPTGAAGAKAPGAASTGSRAVAPGAAKKK